ncbi:mitochondrial biogenesis AIM24-domain-containing protein [Powellomyces hirtus]|nr:mitochondrial biogenesis AIM24-domain-containing protein [Powellomyces hirtus]
MVLLRATTLQLRVRSTLASRQLCAAGNHTLAQSNGVLGVDTLNAKPARDLTAGLEALVAPPFGGVSGEKTAGVLVQRSGIQFSIVSPGTESVLRVDVSESTHFYAAAYTAFGASSTVETSLSADGGLARSIARKLAGGAFYREKFQTPENATGQVFIAPQQNATVAAVQMDGSTEYCVRQRSYLASTPDLIFSPVKLFGSGLSEFLCTRVKGTGILAFASYGALHRLALAPGEQYVINRRHIIAWETSLAINPNQLEHPGVAEPMPLQAHLPQEPTPPPPPPPAGAGVAALAHRIRVYAEDSAERVGRRAVSAVVSAVRAVWAGLGHAVLGQQEYYRVTGPGDLYIASRLEPSRFAAKRPTPREPLAQQQRTPTPPPAKRSAPLV